MSDGNLILTTYQKSHPCECENEYNEKYEHVLHKDMSINAVNVVAVRNKINDIYNSVVWTRSGSIELKIKLLEAKLKIPDISIVPRREDKVPYDLLCTTTPIMFLDYGYSDNTSHEMIDSILSILII